MRRKNKDQEEKMDESWLLPYSDMLTLLLALFIVLFAMSEVDSQKYEELAQVFKSEFSSGGGPIDEGANSLTLPNKEPREDANQTGYHHSGDEKDLEQIQEDIHSYINNNDLEDMLETKLTDEGLLVTILTDVTFKSGSAQVNKKGKAIAKEVSHFLDTNPPHEIAISGHADDRPIQNSEFASNWELSVIRSVNFMKLILENENLDPAKFSSKGYGDKHPIVPNTSKANMAKNRRVEVLIWPLQKEDFQENEQNE